MIYYKANIERWLNVNRSTRINSVAKSRSEGVTDSLREAIIQGELRPGERLVEARLAEELGVSTTPVRAALSQLTSEGLVVVYPYKGSYVTEVTPKLVAEVLGVRKRLECFAAELALSQLSGDDFATLTEYAEAMEACVQQQRTYEAVEYDTLFHGLLYQRSGHSLLLDLFFGLQPRIQLMQSYGRLFARPTPAGQTQANHLAIVDALTTGDQDQIRHVIEGHIDHGHALMDEYFEGHA